MNCELKKIHVVEILSSLEDVPMLGEALAALDFNPSSYANKETGIGTTYLLADSAEQAAELRQAAIDGLKDWSEMFTKPLTIECQELAEEDWSQSWKRHFHTFRASDRIVVKPSWETYDAKPGDLVLALDPGMCFGTGYHGTTKACLQFMDELEAKQGSCSFLDAGCGSGILSIGACLLGYKPVFAFDNDPQCIPTTNENMAVAGVSGATVTVADLASYSGQKCKLVVANILAVVLDKYAETVVTYVERPGHLILSGILTEQYDDILRRYTALGCREIGRKTIKEWTSGCFELA